ncbi:ATP synthase subunit I [Aeromonas simiae]|nr:ATP synthase subunit I [Aeromonas simiae]MDO2949625.1 ATP synthase subunit I [Aeromonas simiae]MDO2953332.1 ATP synthase subunit I [Aeromonas simiae]MDO2956956.1 ATP synthase subunit I [Aeromonas simiae]
MKHSRVTGGLALALALMVCQLVLILAIATVWFLLDGEVAGRSALLGGGAFWVPQCLFSVWVMRRKVDKHSAGLVLWDFYGGAGIKLITTTGLFALMFGSGMEISFAPFFCAYFLALVVQWMASFTLNNHY